MLVSGGRVPHPVRGIDDAAGDSRFSLLAVGPMLWTRSLSAAVGVHGGFQIANAVALGMLPDADRVLSCVAFGGVQVVVRPVLIVLARRRGTATPEARSWREQYESSM